MASLEWSPTDNTYDSFILTKRIELREGHCISYTKDEVGVIAKILQFFNSGGNLTGIQLQRYKESELRWSTGRTNMQVGDFEGVDDIKIVACPVVNSGGGKTKRRRRNRVRSRKN